MLKDMRQRLVTVTHDCSPDMHEPDAQGVSAFATGFVFDNSMGGNGYRNIGEMTIGIMREDNPNHIEWFNVASLVALARMAKFPGE